ncbi:MAG: winged helix-turn-helix domain-containing protein [Pseudomonadota bacterium]|nr:winged helix-turn-helix domain-containing protein [Pseudomonadota bacterium]
MRLAIITSNNFFGESLKSLLENYSFKNDISITLKDFSLDNIEEVDVIVSDYKFEQLKYFLKKSNIKENKIQELEKILISEKEFELPSKNNIYIKRPFRFLELVEVLHSMAERLKNKKEENFFLGYLSFMITDRKLSYKDKTVVELTEKESDIIVSLFNSSDRGITKEEVMSQVWMLSPNIETHTFETHLFRLRKKIRENLFLKNLIVNKQGRYYLNHELIGQKN